MHLSSTIPEHYRQCFLQNWLQIRSRQRGGFVKVYTRRLEEHSDMSVLLRTIFYQQTTAFKVNIAFGFILQNVENGEVRYYYPSQNGFIFDSPVLVANHEDLDGVLVQMGNTDWQEYVRRQKPNSKWSILQLTNVAFHVYPIVNRPIGRGERGTFPKWLVENRGLDPLEKDKNTGKLYNDNLCFFRCLARHQGYGLKNLETKTKQLASKYVATLDNPLKFTGVTLTELHRLDKLFGIQTLVYSLEEDGKVELVHRPATRLNQKEVQDALKLNVYNSHFSYIKDMKSFSHCYVCSRCENSFPKAHRLYRHEQSCQAKIRFKYPGGVYHSSKTIFEKIQDEGITVDEELKYSRYRATFDIEVFYPHDSTNLPEKRPKLEYTAEHHLLSISVASNVPGYESPRCFIVEGEGEVKARKTVERFVTYLEDIAQEAARLELTRFSPLFSTIEETLCLGGIESSLHLSQAKWESTGYDNDDDDSESEGEPTDFDWEFIDDSENVESDRSFHRQINQAFEDQGGSEEYSRTTPKTHLPTRQQKKANQIMSDLRHHISELPVVGFNSGKYDLNVLKNVLIPLLVQTQGVKFCVKRHHAYLALKSGTLKFLDISNFLAAGTSYTQFLKAYNCEVEKGFFPYEYVDSLNKLEESQLPPHSAFYSWLRNSNISSEEYQTCQDAWMREGMQTMRDFLVWYNNLDVTPFLEALDKMCGFWQEHGIDMLKEAISLPGLAFKFEMGFLKQQGIHLSSFHDEQTYQLFKNNMVGGPAIIFKRYAEVNKTFIRGNPAKPVSKIVGFDANALYLWALTQPMPVGLYTTWTPSQDGLVPHKTWRAADEWLAWIGHQYGVTSLKTRLDEGEKRLGPNQLPVDGYDEKTKTVFEFNGCYWHGCLTCFDPDDINERCGKTYGELLSDTRTKIEYLESLPNVSQVVQCWECRWTADKRGPEADEIESFLNQHFPGRGEKRETQCELLDRVRNGSFFGCLEVDIDVPTELKAKFEEMTPIFKNTEIRRDAIGPHMQKFAEDHEIMTTPRRALIGSYKGEKILLGSPLLKFYLEEGLVVSRVYQAIQWQPKRCLKPFGDFVSNSRRAADADPQQKILGETAKLVGNSGFGRFLMDVSRHQDVSYHQDEAKITRAINSFFFRDLEELSDQVIELKMSKKRLKMDLPIQIGFFVFQYAKLKMLEFYYRFIAHFLDREDFEYLEMDTDSAYMALSGDSIDALIKPEKKEEYERDKSNWFPRTETEENAAFDKRTPGLFKVEWSGDGFVGLNSKTYSCWSEQGNKASCKGISKRLNNPTKDIYLRVLQTGNSQDGENRGFRVVNNRVLTYSQHRTGFSYFYPKRKVLSDGVSTIPLDI